MRNVINPDETPCQASKPPRAGIGWVIAPTAVAIFVVYAVSFLVGVRSDFWLVSCVALIGSISSLGAMLTLTIVRRVEVSVALLIEFSIVALGFALLAMHLTGTLASTTFFVHHLDSGLLTLATWRLLPVTCAVFAAALVFRQPSMLAWGLIGTFLGPIIVPATPYDQYFPDHANTTVKQWQIIGIYCASLMCLNSWASRQWKKPYDIRFTTRMALLIFLNIGAILGIINAT